MPDERSIRGLGPESTESEGFAEECGSVVLSILLQKHAAAQRGRLALDVLGRLLSAAALAYLGVAASLSVVRLGSGILLAGLVAASWQWGRIRLTRQALGIEETLSRMAGGDPERVYIEARFIAEDGVHLQDLLLRAEPMLWLAATVVVAALGVIVDGLAT